jgi:cyclopropane fatty-acyl-phospholipid synthase-like methyltransferase
MDADSMVARALEAPPELLPFLPELLADLDELGSDAEHIAAIVRDLRVSPDARVVDLGCGKGAVAIEIAGALGLHVLGIDLFEPFVAHCVEAARDAGVAHLCEFRHGDAKRLAGEVCPADIVVFAALGDVLGDTAETMRVVRQYGQPGGHIVISDVFLRDGGSAVFPGFEQYRSRQETIQALTIWGDVLINEVLEEESEADDTTDDEAAAIQRRAVELAARHPEHAEQILAFAAQQGQANAHIAENLIDVVWVLRRADS